jgi:peptide/nickel transport system ATP-binding protein
MYAGRIVESGPLDQVIDAPMHPYTIGLLGSVPSARPRGSRLVQIRGSTPNPLRLGAECAFSSRCDMATEACRQAPVQSVPAPGRTLRCHHAQVAGSGA